MNPRITIPVEQALPVLAAIIPKDQLLMVVSELPQTEQSGTRKGTYVTKNTSGTWTEDPATAGSQIEKVRPMSTSILDWVIAHLPDAGLVKIIGNKEISIP